MCRICDTLVPAGAYCGVCGALLSLERRGIAPAWLRERAHAAAPTEHVLRPSIVTSLFPTLPARSRTAFRLGLALLVMAMVMLAILRWQAPLIAISALGLPLLFHLYLQEADVYDDLPTGLLVVAALLGATFGVGWALLTGSVVAHSYMVAIGMGARVSAQRLVMDGLLIPVGGALLMVTPVLLVRFRRPSRESLDGFLIGSLSAIAFTAAAMLTRMFPQLATGVVARGRPSHALLIEVAIRGVTAPLTAAAAGGLVGAALWMTRLRDSSPRSLLRTAPVPALAAVALCYSAIGIMDVVARTPAAQIAVHLVVTLVAILAVRVRVHVTLLHEAREKVAGGPLLCAHCHRVVPDNGFCPKCGVALHASSRSSRAMRRNVRPNAREGT